MTSPATPLVALITGANRGIGLGLVRRFIRLEWRVIATCRNPDKATELRKVLSESGQPAPLRCDVTDDDSVKQCFEEAKRHTDRLSVLINNAVMSNKNHPTEAPSAMERAEFLSIMDANVAGTAKVTQAFLPLLESGLEKEKRFTPTVANISSKLGSVALANKAPTCISYRCSKAAVNMLTKMLSHEHPQLIFVCLHPGHVATDMGTTQGRTADISVEESAEGIADVVTNVKLPNSGRFFDWKFRQLEY